MNKDDDATNAKLDQMNHDAASAAAAAVGMPMATREGNAAVNDAVFDNLFNMVGIIAAHFDAPRSGVLVMVLAHTVQALEGLALEETHALVEALMEARRCISAGADPATFAPLSARVHEHTTKLAVIEMSKQEVQS